MRTGNVVAFLAGALTFAFLVAVGYFLRFWRRTADRLFLHFALAFALFAANQVLTSIVPIAEEPRGYSYILRVLGYVIILVAIVDKNIFGRKPRG